MHVLAERRRRFMDACMERRSAGVQSDADASWMHVWHIMTCHGSLHHAAQLAVKIKIFWRDGSETRERIRVDSFEIARKVVHDFNAWAARKANIYKFSAEAVEYTFRHAALY